MKTKLNYLLIAVITTVCAGNTFAQNANINSDVAANYSDIPKTGNGASEGILPERKVSPRVLSTFEQSFPDAKNVTWSGVGNKYAVDFIKGEIQHKNLYTAKGNLIYSLFYGSEKELPRDIRNMVRREYLDYNIFKAIEAKEGSRDVWIVSLEDDDNLVTVGVENGSMAELSRYTKCKN